MQEETTVNKEARLSPEKKEEAILNLMKDGDYPREIAELIFNHYDEYWSTARKIRDQILTKEGANLIASLAYLADIEGEEKPWLCMFVHGITEAFEWLSKATNMIILLDEAISLCHHLDLKPMTDEEVHNAAEMATKKREEHLSQLDPEILDIMGDILKP